MLAGRRAGGWSWAGNPEKFRLCYPTRELEALPTVAIGKTLNVQVTTPAALAASYWLAASLQLGTIDLRGGHLVPLWPDPVLDFSL